MDNQPNYGIAIFTQSECKPCSLLHYHLSQEPEKVQNEIEMFPFKTITGQKTAWVESLGVEKTPTLVVFEDTEDAMDTAIEMIVGGTNIRNELYRLLKTYTDLKINDQEEQEYCGGEGCNL